jgi:hypothetical protein
MPKLKYLDLREAVIDTCLQMNAEGINQGTSGNVSVRTPEGFLMTASGIPYHKMKPEHVVEMDLDGGYIGGYLPSTEWRMHMDIFKHRPGGGRCRPHPFDLCHGTLLPEEGHPALPLHDRHRRRHHAALRHLCRIRHAGTL